MANDSINYQKWRESVVHIEGATDSESIETRRRRWGELEQRFQRGEITRSDLEEGYLRGMRDVRSLGTAILVKEANRRYLVTARHVVHDTIEGSRRVQESAEWSQDGPDSFRRNILNGAVQAAETMIYGTIFIVPTLEEVRRAAPQGQFLMNLGAGVYGLGPYLYDVPNDLAVISLDRRFPNVADYLEARGNKAVTLDDFAGSPSSEGAEVFSVGFPSSTSIQADLAEAGIVDRHPMWQSRYTSLPTFAFGRVGMSSDSLPFFWCDLSAYPGMSGGPVVEGGRLVGIVSEQPAIPVEDSGELPETPHHLAVRIPFMKAVKAEYARELIEQQILRDDQTFRESG